MNMVDHPRCGTLPDFGNFRNVVSGGKGKPAIDYDRYLGVHELMPFAKGASAKSYAFDDKGNETTIDYTKMMSIVLDPQFQFSGFVGIEYEGPTDSLDGIRKTKALLDRIRDQS
jgi:hypothetical protein